MSLLEKIHSAGVIGAGGAGFPTHKKLDGAFELLLVNAAECEPLLCSDRYVMREFPGDIIEALLLLKAELNIPRVVIGTKKKYTREIAALNDAIKAQNAGDKIEIFGTHSFYPAGDEQALIYEVTGKTVPPAGIPPMLKIAVINVTTALNIRRALDGVPVTRRYVTVNGAVKSPGIIDAPVGTSVVELIDAAGGAIDREFSVIKGGPMMGPQFTGEAAKGLVIGKADGGILVLPAEHPLIQFSSKPINHMINRAKSVCIQCSYCTELCPRYLIGHRLRPNRVMRSMATGTCEAELSDALLCSECGLCELFSCPMQLSPRKMNIHIKGILREKGVKVEDKNIYPEQTEQREYRRVSQSRIIDRLGLSGYPTELDGVKTYEPAEVHILLKHGVGKPAEPCVKAGEHVDAGGLVAESAYPDVAARVHASITGEVALVDGQGIIIKREGSGK